MASQEEVDRGREAELLLQNPVYADAWEGLRSDLIRDWAHTEPNDVNGRERLWIAVSLLEQLQTKLVQTVNAGRMASEEFDSNRKPLTRHE